MLSRNDRIAHMASWLMMPSYLGIMTRPSRATPLRTGGRKSLSPSSPSARYRRSGASPPAPGAGRPPAGDASQAVTASALLVVRRLSGADGLLVRAVGVGLEPL